MQIVTSMAVSSPDPIFAQITKQLIMSPSNSWSTVVPNNEHYKLRLRYLGQTFKVDATVIYVLLMHTQYQRIN